MLYNVYSLILITMCVLLYETHVSESLKKVALYMTRSLSRLYLLAITADTVRVTAVTFSLESLSDRTNVALSLAANSRAIN